MTNWGDVLTANGLPVTVIDGSQLVPSNPDSSRTGWTLIALSQSRKTVWESSSNTTEGELSTSEPVVSGTSSRWAGTPGRVTSRATTVLVLSVALPVGKRSP